MFVLLGLAVATALAVTWLIVRPMYEQSVIQERLTVAQQFLDYIAVGTDDWVQDRLSQTKALIGEIGARPAEVDGTLRTAMALEPHLVEVRVSSPASSRDLVARQRGLAEGRLDLPQGDEGWIPTSDSTIKALIIPSTPFGIPIIVLRTTLRIGSANFTAVLMLDGTPLFRATERAVFAENGVALSRNDSILVTAGSGPFTASPERSVAGVTTLRRVRWSGEDWNVITSGFQALPLRLTAAIPHRVVVGPVMDLLWSSTLVILIGGAIILVAAWRFTAAVTQPVEVLAREVSRLAELDFATPVTPPDLPELRAMGRSIEAMRVALERYTRINVERIIVEEWKTRTLMTHSDDLIGITDERGVFVFRNTGLDQFWGDLTTSHSLRSIDELLADRRVSVRSEARREDRVEGESVTLLQKELSVALKERTEVHFRLKIVELARHGGPIGSLVILHDLTEDRKIDQMRNDMINVIVHEMRNPAGGIRGIAEILFEIDRMKPEDVKMFVRHIFDGAQRLLDLINRFLDIQRLESGRVEYPKTRLDLATLVRAVVMSQKPYLLEKRLEVDVRAPEPLEAFVATELMRDAIQNLVSNAIKYGDPDRTIAIDVRSEGDKALIAVTDHGYGIPPKDQEKIFSKFFRVASNSKAAKQVGTGLGLAYVKEIMTHHGGTVEFESNESMGCRFTLHIPVEMRA
jgi:signal transduction histidine kinase